MAMTAIEKITRTTTRVRNGKHRVQPGQAGRLSEAASAGDFARQGDLYLIVRDAVPENYRRIDEPTDADRQLVPGNTQGARHCLDSLDGVTLYRPRDWSEEGLAGPAMVLTEERTVQHPTHGDVTIPAGMTIACRYQREWDVEQRRERRNAD